MTSQRVATNGGRMDALTLLQQLVQIETPTGDVAASRKIADLLASWLRQLGGAVELISLDSGTCLRAEFAGVGDPIVLIGHTDTVWPVGTLAGDVPWTRDGDCVRGPGVYDMKGGIVVALLALAQLQGRQHRALRVVLVCDEEKGSPESAARLPAWVAGAHCVIGLESPHPDGALKVGRRGSTRVGLAVTGRSAHAALDPKSGVSAINELLDQLRRVDAIATAASERSEVLCNIGTIAGGGRANVIAANAEAEIGLRFIDPDTEVAVLEELDALAPIREGATVTATVRTRRPTWKASVADDELAARLVALAGDAGELPGARPAAGGGDTNLLGHLGFVTVDGFGPRGGGAHALDERCSLASLQSRAETLARFARQC